ncbi:aspartate aminotransferase family protein [Geodermatophilus arenarius]|uniref:Aminotransferase class III-fold pyridoxal phosphate-dependent enzyme n=1 Tax=Geodermatophilus arenarius TaxID=1137990 RepID=A0ABV9LE31_9ACTN
MTVAELRDRARRVMPGGNTRSTLFVPPHPPYAVSGSGCVVTDATGHQVVDCNNNYTALIHGHAHPELVAVATEAVAAGSAFGLPTESEVVCAELLRERVGLPSWRFCNSGTEAVMMALRGARAATGRDLVVRFAGSYHGTYDAVVDPTAPGVPGSVAEAVVTLPQGDAGAFADLMRARGGEVAAVLVDLMPNRAGLRPADPSFVELVAALTRGAGALLVVDEVITLRLEVGGLHSRYGVEPDLVTVGKVVGGGFPVGGVGGRREVLDAFSPLADGAVSWGGTFSANPVTMRTGTAALRLFGADEVAALNARGDRLREELAARGVAVSGSGSLVRLLLPDPGATWWRLYERGVLAGTNGLLALSTPMTDDDVDTVRDAVLAAVEVAA